MRNKQTTPKHITSVDFRPALYFTGITIPIHTMNIIQNKTALAQGRLLLADPFMLSPSFRRSVVLLAEYTPEGSVGFVLNRPTDFTFNDIVSGFPEFPSPVFLGGPVEGGTLHFLHALPDLDDSYEVSPGVFWGGNLDVLKARIKSGSIVPSDIRFFIGYAGWAPNQLEEEVAQKSWIIAPGNSPFVFSEKPSSLWSNVLRSLGEDYAMLVHSPSHPSLN
jgi:putative transcriptional regulator